MSDKTFYAHVERDNGVKQHIRAVGYVSHSNFVSFHFGGFVEIGMILKPHEARAIADALNAAADFAQPREVSSADLGLGEAA